MALYRNISTKFWSDAKIVNNFTPEDKYFMFYCLTNIYTNLCGCYEISVKQISNDIGYSKEKVEKLIDRLTKIHKVIDYDFKNQEMLIINWNKYNWTSSSKLDKPLLECIKNIKTFRFKEYLTKIYNNRDTVSIPYIYPSDTSVSVSVSDTVSITDNSINSSYIDSNNKGEEKENKEEKKERYGEYKNVLLTKEEYEKLNLKYSNADELIKYLDEYIEMKGYKAKRHYLCFDKWVVDAVNKQKKGEWWNE